MSARQLLIDRWVDQPSVDVVLATAAALLAAGLGWTGGVTPDARATCFQTFAEISGILLTLGTLVITLLFTVAPNDRLALVLRVAGDRLRRLVLRCLGGLVVSTAVFGALFLIEPIGERLAMSMFSAATALMVSRFGRLWWVLNRVLSVLLTAHTADPASPEWERPLVGATDYHVSERRPRLSRVRNR